jgi:hypothetical protein
MIEIYPIVLALHNITRWLVLFLGVWSCVQLWVGHIQHLTWRPINTLLLRVFAYVISVQCVLGFIVYLTPDGFVNGILNLGVVVWMKNTILRFYALEHPLQMFIAIAVSHINNYIVRHRLKSDVQRYKVGAWLMLFVILLIITAVPWPFLVHGRPWLRGV